MIKTIALYEFWFAIRRPSYYLLTFGMPLIGLAYFGLIFIIVLASMPSQVSKMNQPVGVIDNLGRLTAADGPLHGSAFGDRVDIEMDLAKEIPDLGPLEIDMGELKLNRKRSVILLPDIESARAALLDGTVSQVTEIPDDYMQEGQFKVYVRESDMFGSAPGNGWIRDIISTQILNGSGLSQDAIRRVKSKSKSIEYKLDGENQFVEINRLSEIFSFSMPLAISGLLIIALMMNAGLLLTSIAEEKENKVMEVIVSSVAADHLLLGKVLGIVMAGLLQIAIWMVMMSVVPALSMLVMQESFAYEINLPNLVVGGVFVLAGFVFYGCLLAGLGSLGSNYKDCQQLSVAVILCACVPFMVPTVFLSNPNGWVAVTLSMIPLFSPVAMMGRLGCGEVPWWQVGVSFVILLISIYFAVKIGGKLFRAGTLMQGKRPGLAEIWKVLIEPV